MLSEDGPAGSAQILTRLLLGHLPSRRDRHLQDLATAVLRDSDGRNGILDVVNATLAVRRDLTFWLYLEPRRQWSRLTYRPTPQAGPDRRLSLLCPSRERPRDLASFLRSVQRTAAWPARVEVLVYVDDDDPLLAEYRRLLAPARWSGLGGCRLIVGPPDGVPQAWNSLAAQARGDLLMMANDDQLYVDFGWDAALDEQASRLAATHGDDVMCLYFDDGQYAEGGRDFPVVTRTWYTVLGYFTPTAFQQWEVERWIFDIAVRVDRCHAVHGVFVEHRHYQDYKAPFDSTYFRHRVTREKSFADHALYLRTERWRAAEAQQLRAAMAADPKAAPAGDTCESEAPWFADDLLGSRARMAAEAQSWREAAGTGPGADRVVLWQAGGSAIDDQGRFPVIVDVVAAIPEVAAAAGGTAVLHRLAAGAEVTIPVADPRGHSVLLALCDSARLELRLDGCGLPWLAGECVPVVVDTSCHVTNDGAEPVALLVLGTVAPAGKPRDGR